MESIFVTSTIALLVGLLLGNVALRRVKLGGKPSSSGNETEQVLSNLNTRVKALELEWENTYAKLYKLAGRLSKERGLADGGVLPVDAAAAPTRQSLARR